MAGNSVDPNDLPLSPSGPVDPNIPTAGGAPSFDPNNPGSINTYANKSLASSAPPYQPILGQQGTQDILSKEQQNAYNPRLTQGEKQTYTPIQNQPENMLNPQNYNAYIFPSTPTVDAQASTIANPHETGPSTYNATMGTAAQGQVDQNSLVQNQFENLMNSNKDQNGVPDWARTAVTAANQQMNSLGLGASTMAGNATATAILSTALPMAEQNAQTYANLNLANLSNRQQTMLSNQAAANVAAQFNSTNTQQNAQFFATLATNVATQNAQMQTAVSQYNAGQKNAAIQFNQSMQNQQQEFNLSNQLAVDQSNVTWQRAINTANTAGLNAANQANAQNLFNISQQDQNNLWQQAADEASWSLTSSENAQNRSLSLVTSSMNDQTSQALLRSQLNANMYQSLGALGANVIGGVFSSLFNSNTPVSQTIARPNTNVAETPNSPMG